MTEDIYFQTGHFADCGQVKIDPNRFFGKGAVTLQSLGKTLGHEKTMQTLLV